MTGTNDNDEDVPTLLSWSAGDNCSVRALRRLYAALQCVISHAARGTSSLSAVCPGAGAKLPDNMKSRAGPGTSARPHPVHRCFAPPFAVASVTRTPGLGQG